MTTVTSRRGWLTASDPRGSRRAYWLAQVAAHEGSGLSGAAFCRRRGLHEGTLTFWRWKFAQEARTAPRQASCPSGSRPRGRDSREN